MTMTHKTRSVFERYDIVAGSDLADAADRLQMFLTGKSPETRKAGKVAKVPTALCALDCWRLDSARPVALDQPKQRGCKGS
jgi:hypothetical protein